MNQPQPGRRRVLKLLTTSAAALASVNAVGALSRRSGQDFSKILPPGPVRIIVPFTPGTGIDFVARTLSPILSERLGRAVVVDNRPGASGIIGTDAVVKAAPDGLTLLASVNTLAMNRSLYRTLPFNPLTDLTPIGLTSWGQLALVAHPDAGFKTPTDLIEADRKNPGKINYGSPGIGTPQHLAMELFNSQAGTSITNVPYRGTSPVLTDLLGGVIQVTVMTIPVALPHVRAGKLLPLAICSGRRHDLLQGVPTLTESGVPGVEVDSWYGLFGPARVPAAVITALNEELQDILAKPDVKAALQAQGLIVASSTPEAFKSIVEKDDQRWAKLIKAKNIRAE